MMICFEYIDLTEGIIPKLAIHGTVLRDCGI